MPSRKLPEPGDGVEHVNRQAPAPKLQVAAKKPPKTKTAPPQVLAICRNKHWRYISSFHGPWLQLPPEVLEIIAHANYNTPRPRPVDPAVFFDLVTIRRLVDDATNLAVRAASGVASIGQQGLHGASPHAAALGFNFGPRPPPQMKLSPERKHRMREQATQKLAQAYRLDEIACSVATMQGASSLEEVASLALQRNPQDPDAKYVHFFHEKIPSRQLAECTSLTPLSEILASRPSNPEPLRTRAVVRVFKGDYQGAVDDLTEALKLHRLYRPARSALKLPQQESQVSVRQQHGASQRQEDVILKEDDQPSSLETQLLFQRAGVYLAIACRHVAAAVSGYPMAPDPTATDGHPNDLTQGEVAQQDPKSKSSVTEKEVQRRAAEARRLVRHNAKRALRDYTAYLSHFEYSPDLPIEIADDFTRKVDSAVNGTRPPRSHSRPPRARSPGDSPGEEPPSAHRIFAISDLFTPSPPSGLPPYPSTELVAVASAASLPGPMQTTTETLTCHPLLTEALHALLLCHSLIQTSAKELLRHAYMVARLTRLADGYPIFQSSRCSTRADWVKILRAGGNWIKLTGSWEDLCAPAPLPLPPCTCNGATPFKCDVQHQAVLDAFGDGCITDESTLRQATRSRQLSAEDGYRLESAVAALDEQLMEGKNGAAARPSDDGTALPLRTTDHGSAISSTASDAERSFIPAAGTTNSITTNSTTTKSITTNGTTTKSIATNGTSIPAAAVPTNSPTTQPQSPRAAEHRQTDSRTNSTYPSPPSLSPSLSPSSSAFPDYFPCVSTERATAIACWVLHAPAPEAGEAGAGAAGSGRRRKV